MQNFLYIIVTFRHLELTLVLRYVSWVLCVYIFRWSRECSKDDVDSEHGARQLHGHCCRRANPGSSHWSVSADLPWHPVPGPDGKHLCGPEMPKLVLIALIPFFSFYWLFLIWSFSLHCLFFFLTLYRHSTRQLQTRLLFEAYSEGFKAGDLHGRHGQSSNPNGCSCQWGTVQYCIFANSKRFSGVCGTNWIKSKDISPVSWSSYL